MNKLVGLLATLLIITAFGCSSKVVKKEVEEKSTPTDVKTVVLSDVKPDNPSSGFLLRNEVQSQQPLIHFRAFQYYDDAVILNEVGDYANAAKKLTKALQYYPNSYEIRYALAEDLYKMNRFHDVLMVLDVITPKTIQSHLLRVHSFISLNYIDSAMTTFGDMIELNPDDQTPYLYLANIYKQMGNLDSLKWAYENLTRIVPINPENWRELGRLQAQTGDFESANNSFNKSLLADPSANNILAYVSLAEIALMQNKSDTAFAILLDAYKVDQENVIINRELALNYLRMDSLELALPYSVNLARLNPSDKPTQRRLGAIYYGLDSLDQAEAIYTKLVNEGDQHSLNHYYLGRIAAQRSDFNIAVEEFTFLTQMADTVYESWLDLGFSYRQLGQDEKETETYQAGLNHMKTEKDALQLMFALAASFERRNLIDEAVESFEAILDRSPEYDQALNYLGYMLADRNKRLDYAQELIKKALDIKPNNPAYLDSYGWVLYRLGDFDKALKHLNRAAEMATDSVIFDHLGDVYKADGDLKKAQVWWEKALELAPDDEKIKTKLNE